MSLLALLAAVLFAAIHLFGEQLRFLDLIPRSRWLSAAGGASVAYVFLHLLPELEAGQGALRERIGLEHPVYLLALAGLVGFYGLERHVKVAQRRTDSATGGEAPTEGGKSVPEGVFWLHVASFAGYNLLIGYLLLHREDHTETGFWLYVLAMGLHFLVNDYGLRQDHRRDYHHRARWVLAAAIVAGWALGLFVTIPEAGVIALTALLGGAVVLNVLKEELPEERESQFSAFLLGAASYATLLLVI